MSDIHLSSGRPAVHATGLAMPRLGLLGPARWPLVALALVATLATLALNASVAISVWHGALFDPDDAMRRVEVRAWLGGQPWYDVTAMRLDPPGGASMHWSRLVDVPNAVLTRLFSLFGDHAEALDAIVLPTLWLLLLCVGIARLASVLVGRRAVGTALLGMVLSGAALAQFQPGRIGHHAPETVILVFALGAALQSFDPARRWRAALAGALVAPALAMSLETLPFLVGLAGALVASWCVRGGAMRPMLGRFGLGLGLALPACFAAQIPPAHWFAPVCDALGMAHLGAGLIGAAGCVVLASVPDAWLGTPWRRLGAAIGLAVVAAGFVALFYPACLGSPFAGVDPLVRALWLDGVVESKPLAAFLALRPMLGLSLVLPTVLGILAGATAAMRSHGVARQRIAIVTALAAIGLALGCWQVRAFTTTAPLAMCCVLPALAELRPRLVRAGFGALARLAPAAILPFTGTFWALALPQDATASSKRAECLAPAAFAPLAALPVGRILAPIDAGSHLLAYTPHSVFAAPYHRNDDGNRFAFDAWLAPPASARGLLVGRHVAYVVTCDGMGETRRIAARAPGGLAAALVAGPLPAFLEPLPMAGTPYRVFAVKPGP